MPPIKQLKLEKEMYTEAKSLGIGFGDLLEKLDPSESYTGKLGKMTAFQRQCAQLGLKTSGRDAALVEAFFSTTASKVLFPEYIAQQLLIGLKKGRRSATLADIVSVTNQIDSTSYKTMEIDLDNTDVDYKRTAEGAKFPVAKVRTKEKAITLYKIGTKLEFSYEAIRRMKLNVLGAALQVLGTKLGQDLVYEGLEVLLNGDGNSNSAGNVNSATTGAIVYGDLLNLDFVFEDGFEPDMIVANKAAMKKILSVSEFINPLIASDFLTKGQGVTPFGLALKVNNKLPDGKLLALNKIGGLEMLEEKGAQMVEVDKIIDRQLQGSIISKVVGFSKIFKSSANTLTFNW
jgi:HK97 family phage major capsid protein